MEAKAKRPNSKTATTTTNSSSGRGEGAGSWKKKRTASTSEIACRTTAGLRSAEEVEKLLGTRRLGKEKDLSDFPVRQKARGKLCFPPRWSLRLWQRDGRIWSAIAQYRTVAYALLEEEERTMLDVPGFRVPPTFASMIFLEERTTMWNVLRYKLRKKKTTNGLNEAEAYVLEVLTDASDLKHYEKT